MLFSIRHFNSQEKIGQGGQNYGAKTTGLMNAMGPFAGSSSTSTGDSQGVKAYIENPWGHNYDYLGDFEYFMPGGMCAFQTSTQSPTSAIDGGISVDASPYSLTSPSSASGSISTEPETWGWGIGSGGSKTTGGCDYQYLPTSRLPFGIVGGGSSGVSHGDAGVSFLDRGHGGDSVSYGGRLVFVFDL